MDAKEMEALEREIWQRRGATLKASRLFTRGSVRHAEAYGMFMGLETALAIMAKHGFNYVCSDVFDAR